MKIRTDDLQGREVAALLQEHLDEMHRITPAGSVHALDLDSLRSPDITFWCAWDGDALMGCGALKQLDSRCGEIKSMRTAGKHRGKGVASKILEHIIGVARERNYRKLKLETGAFPEFAPARKLYESRGFTFCGPFAGYLPDPNSVFMSLQLDQGQPGPIE